MRTHLYSFRPRCDVSRVLRRPILGYKASKVMLYKHLESSRGSTVATKRVKVPVPKPDLTPRAMIESAIAMRPALRQRQAACEEARRLLDETQAACVEAGFYRILQPRRFGGYEFDLPTFAKVAIEISRGCPSTGWAVIFTAGHTHVFAKFSQRAQVEGYGADGEFRAPFVGGSANATAEPVDGGYTISGTWDYASAIDTATHFFGAIPQMPSAPGETPRLMVALFNRDQIEIIDNWDMLGMRGTGSKRVQVKDAFVPVYRTLSRDLMARSEYGEQGGRRPSANPMYVGPSGNILMAEIAAVAIGTGYAALDAYEEMLKNRTLRGPGAVSRAQAPEFQRRFSHAQALLETARDALFGCTSDFMEYCELDVKEGVPFDAEKSQRITMVEQQCCRIAGEAVEMLFFSAGSSAGRPGEALGRYYRDMATLRTHVSLQLDRPFEQFARLHFGLGPPGPGAQQPAAELTTADLLP